MARRRKSASRDWGRKVNARIPKKAILIVAEGAVSEILYFEGLKKHLGLPEQLLDFQVTSIGSGDVKTLIEKAASLEELRRKDKSPLAKDYDEVWIVFDADTIARGGNNEQARDRINRINNKLKENCDLEDSSWYFGYSNLSFEFFMLLHFEKTSKTFTKDELTDKVRKISKLENFKNKKELEGSEFLQLLMKNWKVGMNNALWIEKHHIDSGSEFPNDVSNTTLGRLLKSIETNIAADNKE